MAEPRAFVLLSHSLVTCFRRTGYGVHILQFLRRFVWANNRFGAMSNNVRVIPTLFRNILPRAMKVIPRDIQLDRLLNVLEMGLNGAVPAPKKITGASGCFSSDHSPAHASVTDTLARCYYYGICSACRCCKGSIKPTQQQQLHRTNAFNCISDDFLRK